MSDLKPCPFCGITCLSFEDGSSHRWGVASCDGCGATTGEVRRNYPDDGKWHAEAIEAWNRRAQPAQAVPPLTYEQIAAEIRERGQLLDGVAGDRFIQGARWAESQVRSKLLPEHECTRSHPHENMDRLCILRTEIARLNNENARLKSGFSDAAQVLTLDEISDLAMQSGAHDEQLLAFARAIESLVRSKLGAGVPMTDEQAGRIAIDDGWNASDPEYRAFIDGIRAAERHHGIVGKEGGK